jgi:hypothetical protein
MARLGSSPATERSPRRPGAEEPIPRSTPSAAALTTLATTEREIMRVLEAEAQRALVRAQPHG